MDQSLRYSPHPLLHPAPHPHPLGPLSSSLIMRVSLFDPRTNISLGIVDISTTNLSVHVYNNDAIRDTASDVISRDVILEDPVTVSSSTAGMVAGGKVGAGYYVIAVLVVYSFSVVLLLASGIKRRREKRGEDRDIEKYLQEYQVVRERSSRDSYRTMKRAIVAKLSTRRTSSSAGGAGRGSGGGGGCIALSTGSITGIGPGSVGGSFRRSICRAVFPGALQAVTLTALAAVAPVGRNEVVNGPPPPSSSNCDPLPGRPAVAVQAGAGGVLAPRSPRLSGQFPGGALNKQITSSLDKLLSVPPVGCGPGVLGGSGVGGGVVGLVGGGGVGGNRRHSGYTAGPPVIILPTVNEVNDCDYA